MKGCSGGGLLDVFAIILAFIVFSGLSTVRAVSAEDRSTPSAHADADARIASLLTNIEGAIAQGHAVPPDAAQMLISAGKLWSSASPAGRNLLKNFPAQLRKSADEAGDPEARKDLMVFADASTDYIATMTLVDANRLAAPEPSAPPVRQETKSATPPPPASPMGPSLPSHVQRTLLDRGDAMLGLGDVSAARLLYQRAAGAGVGVAAFKLAQTYDPAFLAAHNLRGIRPDPVAAETWYRTAAALGEASATERLKSLPRSRLAGEMTTR